MGFFGNLIGSADNSVLQNGILGRGEITNVTMSGMTLQTGNGLVERKCTITAHVFIDNTPMFVQIAERLGIRSIHHIDYESTRARLASFGLQTHQETLATTPV